ncbi:MAG: sn-glycerol-3-phosphate ABC transporter ATP-binding protein UgpC [Actinobacteria bacterium]|nr:sn-glycerol-3-phosphate ABC transporter ATP-binding protein UgpC [Actinomycetota bacterium]
MPASVPRVLAVRRWVQWPPPHGQRGVSLAEVVLEGVEKVYPDGTQAVADLHLSIGDGEFIVLVGPSGCGKTTALRMVAGLEEISGGQVRIGDRVVNGVPPKDRDIAMVFQNYALYPHLSVRENMGFGLKLRKVPAAEIDKRVEEAGRILGLEDLLDRKPRNLSGGQRQRVAMGRAIVREPQAFLMDEPLSNLDAKLRVQMRAEIARIQRDLDVTTLYVTHDQTEAMTMGDRVAVMRKGLLQQVDAPQVLYDRPDNVFVAGFIGSPAMNMVQASIETSNGATFVCLGDQRLRIADELLAARPALAAYEGRKVVLGIRPEEMEDAACAGENPDDRRLRATVDLVEQMGSEAYVHFSLKAPPVLTDDTRELASDVGLDDQLERRGEKATTAMVARVSPRTRAAKGDSIDLVVDTGRLHFFDIDSSLAVWGDPDRAATTTTTKT